MLEDTKVLPHTAAPDMTLPLAQLVHQPGRVFSAAEALALCPKGVAAREVEDRTTVARYMSDVRHLRPAPEVTGEAARLALEKLVLRSTRAKNAVQVWAPEELDTIHDYLLATTGPESWSKLVLQMARLRRLTAVRYAAYETQRLATSNAA